MQCLEIEDQIELADILEQAIERLNEDLDQIEQRERRLGGGGNYYEVQGCVVAVGYEGRRVVVGRRGSAGFGATGEEGRQTRRVRALSCRQGRRDYGRKLHAEFGRLATRVKISEMSRCWTLVSWTPVSRQRCATRWARRKPAACRTWSAAVGLHC